MNTQIVRHRRHVSLGIGGERVCIYDEGYNYMVAHIKLALVFWTINFYVRYTPKTKA